MNRRTFSKIETWRFLQNYDDELHIWYQFKGPIKGLAMKLKCVYYKIFFKKCYFCQKMLSQSLKIYITLIHFHPLRNIILKLFDDKLSVRIAKACDLTTIIIIRLIHSYSYSRSIFFFMRQMCVSLKDINVTLLTVTLLTMIF